MRVVNEDLLEYFRGRPCESCGKAPPSEPHHARPKGIGGGSRLDVALNLLSLCRECHARLQGDTATCFEMIRHREGLDVMEAQLAVYRLLRRPKGVRP